MKGISLAILRTSQVTPHPAFPMGSCDFGPWQQLSLEDSSFCPTAAYNNVAFSKPSWVISDTWAFFLWGGTTFWDQTPRQLTLAMEKGKNLQERLGERRRDFSAVPIDWDPEVLIRARSGHSLRASPIVTASQHKQLHTPIYGGSIICPAPCQFLMSSCWTLHVQAGRGNDC